MRTILTLAVLCMAVAVAAEIKPLMVGDEIPTAKLRGADGKAFDLKSAASESRLAIIYYRGGWCPYCNMHLAQLQEAEAELRSLGFRILAISPDKPAKLKESLESEKLEYTLLSDSSMETAKAFGIAFEVDQPTLEKLDSYNIDIEAASGEKHHLLPVPSVFLVGTDGIIDFVHANPDYKVRLEPDVLLAAARAVVGNDKR